MKEYLHIVKGALKQRTLFGLGLRVLAIPLITILVLCSMTNYPTIYGFSDSNGLYYKILMKGESVFLGGTKRYYNSDGSSYMGEILEAGEDSVYVSLYRTSRCDHFTVPSTIEHDGKWYKVIYINGKYDSQTAHVFNACSDNDIVESITIEEGILGTGANGFSNCKNLKKIIFPKSFRFVANGCFRGSDNIDSLDFPGPILYGGSLSFNSSKIEYIRVNDLRNISETDSLAIYKVLSDCKGLKDIDIANSPYFQSHEGMVFNSIDSVLLYWAPQKKEIVLPDTIKGVDGKAVDYLQSNVKRLVLSRDLGPFIESGLKEIILKWKDLEELDFSRCKNYRQIDGVVYDMTDSSLVYCPPSVTCLRLPDFVRRFNTQDATYLRNILQNVETIVLSPSLDGVKNSGLEKVFWLWDLIKSFEKPQELDWLDIVDNCVYDKTDSLMKWAPTTITELCPPDYVKGFGDMIGYNYSRYFSNLERFKIPANWPKCTTDSGKFKEWRAFYPGNFYVDFFQQCYKLRTIECAPDCKNYVVIDNKVFSKDTVIHYFSYAEVAGEYVIPKQVKMISGGNLNIRDSIDCMTIYAEEPPLLAGIWYSYPAFPIFVPDESVEKYRTAYPWSNLVLYSYVTGFFPMSQKEQILAIQPATNDGNTPPVTKRYNASGMFLSSPVKGLNILRMSDGTVKKVFVK